MAVSFELPADIENRLRGQFPDLDAQAKEDFAVQLFVDGKLSHGQLSRVLGLSRYETDGVLKRHGVFDDRTVDDVLRDAETSRQARTR